MRIFEAVPTTWEPSVITMFEVLEHLPDPAEFLAEIRQRFSTSTFILSVPSPRRWTKAGNHRDAADYPPNHLTRWNSAELAASLSSRRIFQSGNHLSQAVRFGNSFGFIPRSNALLVRKNAGCTPKCDSHITLASAAKRNHRP